MAEQLLGLEIETHIINGQGDLSNRADEIFEHINASHHLQKELTHSMLEVTADPSSDISELSANLKKELLNGLDIASSLGLHLMPSTTIGKCNPLKREGPRYKTKEIVLGLKNRVMEYHICGTHIHVDKNDDVVAQHTLMTSLDPLFVMMSSSPFFWGENHLKDYRVKIYRNVVYKELPLNGALLGYVTNEEELQKRIDRTYSAWVDQCNLKGVNPEGVHRLDSCWGPLRFSNKTIESRASDTNLFSNVIALATVYAGLNRLIKDSNLEMDYPTYKILKIFENQGLKYGLEDDNVHNYLTNIVALSEKGLHEHEKGYLEPFKKMLRDRKTLSDEMMEYARKKGFYDGNTITPSGAKNLRLYLAERFNEDIRKN